MSAWASSMRQLAPKDSFRGSRRRFLGVLGRRSCVSGVGVAFGGDAGLVQQPALGAGEGAHRFFRLAFGVVHQSSTPSLIAQRRAAERMLRPVLGVQAFSRRQWRVARTRGRTEPESRSPIGVERVEMNRLGRLLGGMAAILTTASTGLANIPPVRCLQAHTRVPGVFDEGFDLIGTVSTARLEGTAQASQRAPEHVRGEIAADHAAADREAVQAHHPMQLLAAQRRIPADPSIAARERERRRREVQRPEPAVARTDQVS